MITARKIYMIGIGGIGMSALARLLISRGVEVSGSDLKRSDIFDDLQRLNAKVLTGHDPARLNAGKPDLVIYSADITKESEGFSELSQAGKLGIRTLTYAEALGELMAQKHGIAVTGTNGKSTTAAVLGLILEAAGTDPEVLVGTKTRAWANARPGKGKYFVAEADEYQRKMMSLKPKMIVLTNIAEDHLDYYKDLSDIKAAFTDFVKTLPPDGILIFNADDRNTVSVVHHASCHKFSFGIRHYADLQALNIRSADGVQFFDMHLNDEPIGSFHLAVPGRFNISNVLGASLAALKLGIDPSAVRHALDSFKGTWRRFEKVGEIAGKPIISDYAHHPAGVALTIQASQEFFAGKKILFVFQPHHRNRTKSLYGEFVEALSKADQLFVSEIFDVAGREHGEQISSKQIAQELVNSGIDAKYTGSLTETEQEIRKVVSKFDAVIFMGAGDIDLLARKLAISK